MLFIEVPQLQRQRSKHAHLMSFCHSPRISSSCLFPWSMQVLRNLTWPCWASFFSWLSCYMKDLSFDSMFSCPINIMKDVDYMWIWHMVTHPILNLELKHVAGRMLLGFPAFAWDNYIPMNSKLGRRLQVATAVFSGSYQCGSHVLCKPQAFGISLFTNDRT